MTTAAMDGKTSERAGRAPLLACALVAAAAVVPYLRVPSQPVIYDGELAILSNAAVQQGPLTGLFGVDFWGQPPRAEHSTRSWRPLVSLTWAIQSRANAGSAAAVHLGDLALHAVASSLVVLLLAAWGVERRWLLPSGLLFAVHPVQTEAVASAVGRADVMAGIGLFGALLLQHRATASRSPLVLRAGALLLVGAAMLCKEYAVAFPFVLILADLAQRVRGPIDATGRRHQVATWAGGLSLLVAYLLARIAVFGDLGGAPANPDFHPLADAPLAVRWATSLALLPLALRLLLLPYALNHHYRTGTVEIPTGLLDWRALAGLALVVTLGVLAGRRWLARREPRPGLSLALVLLPLGPSLHAVSVVGVLFAERFLYVPVAGLALALGWALGAVVAPGRASRVATLALAAALAAFAWKSFDRAADWAQMERLARSSLASYPNGADVWKQLGVALVRDHRPREALEALERAVAINPRDAQAWSVSASLLKAAGRYAEAATALRRVADAAPSPPGAVLREAGEVALLAGRPAEAVEPLRRAHELMPADARSLFYLAQAYLQSGRTEEALAALHGGEQALATDPDALRPLLGQAMLRFGQQRLREGRSEDAVHWAKQAVDSGALPAAGVFLAAMLARAAGETALGEELFARALALDPDLLSEKHAAAVEFTTAGEYDRALSLFDEILGVRPDDVPALLGRGRALVLAGRAAEALEPLERASRLGGGADARALLEQARGGRGS